MNNNKKAKPLNINTSKPLVLVTGANGMLGQDLCPILEDEGYEVVETDINTLDITNSDMVKKVLSEEKPDIVVHCAAYTNVDKAEEDYDTAHKINAVGTENLAKACAQNDITLVYISTDYVFDGESTTPYKPDDKPKLDCCLPYIKRDLEVLRPYIIVMPQSIYGVEREYIKAIKGDAKIVPIYQINTRVVNGKHISKNAQFPPKDVNELSPVIRDWYDARHFHDGGFTGKSYSNFLSVFTYLDSVLISRKLIAL